VTALRTLFVAAARQ